MAASLDYNVYKYGTHELQRVGVWDLDVADKTKYWIVYIHGGAWRDPRITHESFAPSVTRIVEILGGDDHDGDRDTNTNTNANGNPIAAFASLDYRLSPHPLFPQDPATTPRDAYRGAVHPDHLDDVRAGVGFLQRRFGFGARYVLLGHSAGGTLAYQLVAGVSAGEPPPELPAAALGVEGIYDMAGLDARVGGAYAEFLAAAFGPRERWDAAAPARCAGRYGDRFPRGLAALAHSPDDELVDVREMEGMAERLRKDGVEPLVMKDLSGTHDQVWQDGEGIARAVLRILEILKERERKGS